jgi:DNA-binding CsgD family transcriptional regulator
MTEYKCIHDLNQTDNLDDAFKVFDKAIQSKGFNCFQVTCIDVSLAPANFNATFLKSTYPDEWQKIYLENEYPFIDPVAKAILANGQPFYWSQLRSRSKDIEQEYDDIIKKASQFGLADGMGFTYLKNKAKLFALTISKDTVIKDYNYELLADFYFLGNILVNFIEKEMREQKSETVLSPQESEIIALAAIGKTDGDIASLMHLSVNTIRYHWKSMFKKLNSYSRVFAIIRAVNLGLIDLKQFDVTTEDGSIQKFQKSVS